VTDRFAQECAGSNNIGSIKEMDRKEHRDRVLTALNKHRQRATYGAVGDLVGLPALSLMQGLTKGPQYSWVVSKSTGMPTGYAEAEIDSHLRLQSRVLKSRAELEEWLSRHD
jgi:hypothetical protein